VSEVIPIKRVVVSANGNEYESPSAFARHEHQIKTGKSFSKIKIKRANEPLVTKEE